jgi:copper resistance protein C
MRRLAVLLCLLLAPLAAAMPARAHAILMESTPAANATVPAGETRFVLRFNSRIDAARSRLELRGKSALPLDPAAPAEQLVSAATLAPGQYVLRWQVLAVDGHITRGDVPFTVR